MSLGSVQIFLFSKAPDLVFDNNVPKKTDDVVLIVRGSPFHAQQRDGSRNKLNVDLTSATMAASDRVGDGFVTRFVALRFSLENSIYTLKETCIQTKKYIPDAFSYTPCASPSFHELHFARQ